MKPDTILAGKYRLISILGRGGMGSVWRAEHLGLRAPVAIKLLAPALEARPDTLARFHREAQSAANLRSPHVVQIIDHGVDEETQTPFIAMELMEGESLAERLARVGRLPVAETVKVITHAARGLSRAHELGIVHRDLKPGNLFLVQNEDDEVTKVLDFGLAKWQHAPGSVEGASATATGQLLGTPYYMSPEQIGAAGTADHRADLWALGVIAYECLLGVRPFEGDSLVAIAINICSAKVPQPSESLVCQRSSELGSSARSQTLPGRASSLRAGRAGRPQRSKRRRAGTGYGFSRHARLRRRTQRTAPFGEPHDCAQPCSARRAARYASQAGRCRAGSCRGNWVGGRHFA